MKIVLCGHWDTVAGTSLFPASTAEMPSPSCAEALSACARGMRQTLPELEVEIMPFGPGDAFVAACQQSGGAVVPLNVPFDCQDARALGSRVREGAQEGRRSVIEAGHVASVDLWVSFLAGMAGRTSSELEERAEAVGLSEVVASVVAQCREDLGEQAPILAATTLRPFSGMASMLAVNPDLSARTDVSMSMASEWTRAIDEADTTARSALPLLNGTQPRVTSLPGSGAGGGIGAIVAACGGQIRDAGEYLVEVTGFAQRVEGAHLCVILEPYLHGPLLAESYLPALTEVCAGSALPVVAIGMDSSLSRHEIAQWGLHGVMLGVDSADALENLGRRVAHTWLRRVARSI